MILNLSKKTIISSNPLYKIGNIIGVGFLPKHCLDKNDSVVFQNCKFLCNFFLSCDADVLFVNPNNSIRRITTIRREKFVVTINGRVIVLLPKGSAALTGTKVGDFLDLNAELTTAQKKIFLKVPEFIVPVSGAVISKSQNS